MLPLLCRELPAYDLSYFSEQHAQLGHRVFGIGGNNEAVRLIDHELTPST
jgi:ABC-type xylose transport system permease subunit